MEKTGAVGGLVMYMALPEQAEVTTMLQTEALVTISTNCALLVTVLHLPVMSM